MDFKSVLKFHALKLTPKVWVEMSSLAGWELQLILIPCHVTESHFFLDR
jgi:hypothetical protein